MKSHQMRRLLRSAAVAAVALGVLVEADGLAFAQNYAAMSCSQLWYARNAIYAANGYCFRTPQARAVFGPGCFPPYGRLSSYQQREVNQIIYWERVRGCG